MYSLDLWGIIVNWNKLIVNGFFYPFAFPCQFRYASIITFGELEAGLFVNSDDVS